jgi:glutamine amidotransferase-like uncharacterized protein
VIIRVYGGYGASVNGTPLLVKAFQKHLSADVAAITQDEMKNSSEWRKETSLLVFSGKSVGEFKLALGPDVFEQIRQGVFEGAFNYAGICAGAAFASAQIKYRFKAAAPDTKVSGMAETVRLKRPVYSEDEIRMKSGTGLSFFNGLATGPAKSITSQPFSGESEDLILINLRTPYGTSYNSAYWGGPALIPLEKVAMTASSFLAHDGLPMSLSMKYGEGNVTIASHHPEIDSENIWDWAEKRQLTHTEIDRLSHVAAKLDGMAFQYFLHDAGLIVERPVKKQLEPEVEFGFV